MEFIWRTLTRPTLSQGGRPSDFHEADELPSFDQSMAAMESMGLLTATVLRGLGFREGRNQPQHSLVANTIRILSLPDECSSGSCARASEYPVDNCELDTGLWRLPW